MQHLKLVDIYLHECAFSKFSLSRRLDQHRSCGNYVPSLSLPMIQVNTHPSSYIQIRQDYKTTKHSMHLKRITKLNEKKGFI